MNHERWSIRLNYCGHLIFDRMISLLLHHPDAKVRSASFATVAVVLSITPLPEHEAKAIISTLQEVNKSIK
jgi:hypothetical protein